MTVKACQSSLGNASVHMDKTPRTLVDIKNAREARTTEVLKIKDEQIRILTEQSNKLLEAIENGEEEISTIQLEKAHIDDENRQLRESNFIVQSQAKVTGAEFKELKEEAWERNAQLKTITTQHAEVLKCLEVEEEECLRLSTTLNGVEAELRDLKVQHIGLGNDANSTQEEATKTSKKYELQSEEIRILRFEVEVIKRQQSEEAMKASVETESLQEQLRVRKEKQYQLLEKLQNQETARKKAEDQASVMEEMLQKLHLKSTLAETQLHVEISSKLSQADLNKKLTSDNDLLSGKNKEITSKMQKMEQDHVRMEATSRENGDQLREMAEKVFQLLERLKLAELGKTRSLEALRSKEDEAHGLKKNVTYLVKEHSKETKQRVQLQSGLEALQNQVRDLKKHSSQLGQRCKEEGRLKVKMDDANREGEGKVKTLNSRISFLLNKLQTDEEAKGRQQNEVSNIKLKIEKSMSSNRDLQQQLDSFTSTATTLEETLREKEAQLDSACIKLDAFQQLYSEQDEMREEANQRDAAACNTDSFAGGRLRFFIDNKPTLGLFLLKAKNSKDRDWLDRNHCNVFMKKASKSNNKQDLLLQKIAETFGIILTREEEIIKLSEDLEGHTSDVDKLSRKLKLIHERLDEEEESKRRTLLKYINAVKDSANRSVTGCDKSREQGVSVRVGFVNLAEVRNTIAVDSNLHWRFVLSHFFIWKTCLRDDEIHAISAMLRENETITELNLRGNMISDEGCRALASILSGSSSLERIDLRENRITVKGIKLIVEALDRSTRVHHVHVHTSGKVDAFGQEIEDSASCAVKQSNIVCKVDIRDNSKPGDVLLCQEDLFGLPISISDNTISKSGKGSKKEIDRMQKREQCLSLLTPAQI